MDGRVGNDELRGGRVADRIEGGNGSDTVYAGRGADFVNVRGDYSRDYVYCGAGVDTVNNMPGPGPAHFFAADREECVYWRRVGGGALRTHRGGGVPCWGSGPHLFLASANPRAR
jgi:Ca2+-binding RTX toxin-like protein